MNGSADFGIAGCVWLAAYVYGQLLRFCFIGRSSARLLVSLLRLAGSFLVCSGRALVGFVTLFFVFALQFSFVWLRSWCLVVWWYGARTFFLFVLLWVRPAYRKCVAAL